MTPEEKFQFDLEGYLVIEGVLSAAEVTELNRIADTEFPHNDDGSVSGEWSMLPFGEPFKRLIDHPRLVPYLAELLGPLLADPERLVAMAAAARAVGRPEAADRLADLIAHHAAPRREDGPDA